MNKILPKDITSYDLLKMVAVILMIIDHIGWYFYPEDLWWRVVGRTCVPLWFFLIGYAQSRDLGPMLWGGAVILIVGNLVVGMPILPLNILVSILAIRLCLDSVMAQALKSRRSFWAIAVLCALLALPTTLVGEYGTAGLLMAMFGYLMRHQRKSKQSELFWLFTAAVFIVLQRLLFEFSGAQFLIMALGVATAFAIVTRFKPETYPAMTQKMPAAVTGIIQFFGRRTLEIYVAHLLLFKALGLWADPERFQLLHITWI